MIIYHKTHVAAFTGAHLFYWPTQPLLVQNARCVPVIVIAGVTVTAVSFLEKTFSVDSTMEQSLTEDSQMEQSFTEDSKVVIP